MSHLYYWSPGAATQPVRLGNDDHYLRLGEYIATQEPADANIARDGVAQGIFLYTSGKYSLKATKALHQEVDGPVTRTVKTGNLTYTNEDGKFSMTAHEGAVAITAKQSIKISAAQETTDDKTTSISINAADKQKDVYFIQSFYFKAVTDYEEKIVKAHNHKTNIGILFNAHAGAGMTTSFSLELSYSTFSLSFTAAEVSVKGLALALEANKKTVTAIGAASFSVVEGKKVFIDEEFCWIKNEVKAFRFTKGFAEVWKEGARARLCVAMEKDDAAAEAAFKANKVYS